MNFQPILFLSIFFTLSDTNENRHNVPTYFHLVNEPYYIDKSEILRYLFESDYNATRVPFYYISCPIGFGKKTNLMMIRAFAELEVDPDTKRSKHWKKTTAALFFPHLNIGRYSNVIKNSLGRHPIVYMNLQISPSNNIRSYKRVLNDLIFDTIREYKWLADILEYNLNLPLPPERKWYQKKQPYHDDQFVKFFNVERSSAKFFVTLFYEDVSLEEAESALLHIGKVLYGYFGNTKVILLVENFQDMSLHAFAICSRMGVKLYWHINNMMEQGLLHTRCYDFAVVTCTGGIARTIHPPEAFLDDHPFTNYFGFMERDLYQLFYRYNITEQYQNLLLSYGHLTVTKDREIYQASTTIDLILDIYEYGRILPYSHYEWVDSRWHNLVVPFLEVSDLFRNKIESLLTNGSLLYDIPKQLERGTFSELIEVCSRGYQVEIFDMEVDAIVNLCFNLGYYCHAPGTEYNFTAANPGVREVWRGTMHKWGALYSTVKVVIQNPPPNSSESYAVEIESDAEFDINFVDSL